MRNIREFHAATHKRFSRLLEHLGTVPAHLVITPVLGFGKNTIGKQVNHVLYSEWTWVGALSGKFEAKDWNHEEYRLPALIECRRVVADRTALYLDSISEEALHQNLPSYPDFWVGPPRTPSFILHQVITHAFHHKGQIVAMCRILGHPAPDTDLQLG